MEIKKVVHCHYDPTTGKTTKHKLNQKELKEWKEKNIKKIKEQSDDNSGN